MHHRAGTADTMRALEALSQVPLSCPQLAERIGVGTRTARRIIYTLRDGGFVEQGVSNYRKQWYLARRARELGLALLLADLSDRPAAFREHEAMRAHVAAARHVHQKRA